MNRIRFLKRINKEQKGVALIELALILPLIALLVFTGLEFSRSLKHIQLAAALSREVASLALRECISDSDERVPYCLEIIQADIEEFGSRLISDTELIVSIYRYHREDNNFKRVGSAGGSKYASRFEEEEEGLTDSLHVSLTGAETVIAIGEAYVPFYAIVSKVEKYLGYQSGVYYDATIM